MREAAASDAAGTAAMAIDAVFEKVAADDSAAVGRAFAAQLQTEFEQVLSGAFDAAERCATRVLVQLKSTDKARRQLGLGLQWDARARAEQQQRLRLDGDAWDGHRRALRSDHKRLARAAEKSGGEQEEAKGAPPIQLVRHVGHVGTADGMPTCAAPFHFARTAS